MYIFDPTALCISEIDNSKKASLITGTGSSYIDPISSYAYTEEEELLRKFMKYRGNCPYTINTIKTISDNNFSFFKDNNIIKSFYDDNKITINKIANGVNKIKRKKV